MFGTIKVAGKFEREMEQNCSEHQEETFERARFRRFNTLANDPLFSKDVLSGYVDQKEAPSKRTLACATIKLKSKVASMCVVPVKVKCSNCKKFRTHALDCCSQGNSISTDLARKLKAEGV